MRVAAAGAAAGFAFGRLFALGDLEAVPTAARGGDVRVLDLEAGLLEPFQEVDRRALQVRGAERIDDDPDAVELELVVACLRAAVEAERVLEAAAPAALDRDAEHLGLAGRLGGHEAPNLGRRALGERHDSGLGLFDRGHLPQCSRRASGGNFVTRATPIGTRLAGSFVLLASGRENVLFRRQQACSTTGCRLRSTGSSL